MTQLISILVFLVVFAIISIVKASVRGARAAKEFSDLQDRQSILSTFSITSDIDKRMMENQVSSKDASKGIAVDQEASSRVDYEKQTLHVDLEELSNLSNLVKFHVDLARMLKISSNYTYEQMMRHLAFELGVLEYFEANHLNMFLDRDIIDDRIAGKLKFLSLLEFYTGRFYPGISNDIYEIYKEMLDNGHMLRERGLGFDSVDDMADENGNMRVGFYPGAYYARAVKL